MISVRPVQVLNRVGLQHVLSKQSLSEEAMCSCGNEYQSMDHLLFHCANTSAQQEVLKQQIGTWPTSKQDLITKHQKEFCVFVESIDFDDLQLGNQCT